ncbi:MAG: ABC transporter ATP-binding protein [Clostridia bacterium]|nr:ABC transporter ATP-binding protein [Clostridia bacterium]
MQFKNFTVSYGKKEILKALTFELSPRSLTVLVGKNGSGKSTLLRAVNREVPYRGELLLEGKPLASLSLREQAKRIAFLPQLLPTPALTVEGLAALGRSPYLGLSGRLAESDRKKIEAALRLSGAEAWRDRPLSTLSGGERQRAYLAMILAQDADIWLLDEPTTYLDPGAVSDFLALLRTLAREQDKAILAVLHDLNAAVAYADRLLLLHEGRLADPAALEQVFGVQKYTAEDGSVFYR